jgi:hypothetical protein
MPLVMHLIAAFTILAGCQRSSVKPGAAALASDMHCSALLPESIAGKEWIEFGDVLARHRIY